MEFCSRYSIVVGRLTSLEGDEDNPSDSGCQSVFSQKAGHQGTIRPGPAIAKAAPRVAKTTQPLSVSALATAVHNSTITSFPATGVHRPIRRNAPALSAIDC